MANHCFSLEQPQAGCHEMSSLAIKKPLFTHPSCPPPACCHWPKQLHWDWQSSTWHREKNKQQRILELNTNPQTTAPTGQPQSTGGGGEMQRVASSGGHSLPHTCISYIPSFYLPHSLSCLIFPWKMNEATQRYHRLLGGVKITSAFPHNIQYVRETHTRSEWPSGKADKGSRAHEGQDKWEIRTQFIGGGGEKVMSVFGKFWICLFAN